MNAERPRGPGSAPLWLMVAVTVALAAACATTGDSRLPVRRFVANTDFAGGYRISPDGEKLVWIETVWFDAGLALRRIGEDDAKRFATGRVAPWWSVPINYAWANDSRHVAYLRDATGAENTQLFVIDADRPGDGPRNLTPWPGVRSLIVSIEHAKPGHLYFQANRRNRTEFDLYEADLTSGETREVARNPGRVTHWIIDADGTLGGRLRLVESRIDAERVFEIHDAAADRWREVRRWDAFSGTRVRALDRRRGVALLYSDAGRDKLSLVEISLKDSTEHVLFADDRIDLWATYLRPNSAQPYAVRIEPDYSETRVLDPALDAELRDALAKQYPAGILGMRLGGSDDSLTRLIVRPHTRDGALEMLFDRGKRTLTTLRDESREADTRSLTDMEPIRLTSRDGLTLHGYLLRPVARTRRPSPMVVTIHGGPWSRDFWLPKETTGDGSMAQFLANRGYTVLKVNYRGSSGYGKAFMNAGIGELGRKSQDDIEDAVRWAVREGIADPRRIAVMGGSFGGFSTLMQLARSPDLYACGISVVGVANWVRLIENMPPYWRDFAHVYHRFYGDPADPDDRARLIEQSPISHVAQIRAPLLLVHGANDVRVSAQDSEDMAAALRTAGKPVEHLVFDDEGHSIRKWRNRWVLFERVESFLDSCLGGDAAG